MVLCVVVMVVVWDDVSDVVCDDEIVVVTEVVPVVVGVVRRHLVSEEPASWRVPSDAARTMPLSTSITLEHESDAVVSYRRTPPAAHVTPRRGLLRVNEATNALSRTAVASQSGEDDGSTDSADNVESNDAHTMFPVNAAEVLQSRCKSFSIAACRSQNTTGTTIKFRSTLSVHCM